MHTHHKRTILFHKWRLQDTKVKHIHHLLKILKTFLNRRYRFFPDTTIQKSLTFKFNIKSQSTFTEFKP